MSFPFIARRVVMLPETRQEPLYWSDSSDTDASVTETPRGQSTAERPPPPFRRFPERDGRLGVPPEEQEAGTLTTEDPWLHAAKVPSIHTWNPVDHDRTKVDFHTREFLRAEKAGIKRRHGDVSYPVVGKLQCEDPNKRACYPKPAPLPPHKNCYY